MQGWCKKYDFKTGTIDDNSTAGTLHSLNYSRGKIYLFYKKVLPLNFQKLAIHANLLASPMIFCL